MLGRLGCGNVARESLKRLPQIGTRAAKQPPFLSETLVTILHTVRIDPIVNNLPTMRIIFAEIAFLNARCINYEAVLIPSL
jgi:hypothetical protein